MTTLQGAEGAEGVVMQKIIIDLHKETEEKARQPETKLSAIAQTRHIAKLRDAKRSSTRNPKPTHGARDRPKQSQLKAGRDRASEPGGILLYGMVWYGLPACIWPASVADGICLSVMH
jgi:hypothetical protein